MGVLALAALGYVGYRTFPREAAEVVTPAEEFTPGEQPIDLSQYTMIERSGEEYNFEQLKGTVWVANTFFASCPHQCRAMTEAVATLQRLPEFGEVKFVSISVDPAKDTPQALAEYADTFAADKQRWLFMSADLTEVNRLGKEMGAKTGYQVHTQELIVFDHTGRYRGGFQFNVEAEVEQLRKLLLELLEEQQKSAA